MNYNAEHALYNMHKLFEYGGKQRGGQGHDTLRAADVRRVSGRKVNASDIWRAERRRAAYDEECQDAEQDAQEPRLHRRVSLWQHRGRVRYTCASQRGHVRHMDLITSTLPKGTVFFSTVLRQLESMDHAYRGSLRDVTTQDESGHLSYRTTFLRTDSNYAPLFAEPAERIRTRESVIEIRQCRFELCRQRHSCEQQSEPAL